MKGGLLLFLKRKLAEQTIILISISKWILLAAVVGAMIGISTTLFLKLLNWSIAFAGQYRYFFLLMPVAFLVSVLMIKYLAPQAEGHGTEKIIDAVHRHSGKIRLAVVPVKLVTTVITIALGGSAGKEGPAAQIGAALASGFSDLLKFDDSDRKKLVICGISAGFGAVFGTPISGAVFGIEVLFAGFMMYDVLLPSFIAAITASVAASALGMVYFYNPFGDVPAFSLFFFLKLIAAGVLFGVVSMLLIEMMDICHKLAGKLRPLLRPLVGGVLLIGLTFLFSRDYLGLGVSTIESTLTGVQIVWYAFLLKIVFTAVTLGFGGSGGIITPIFFIGAVSGSAIGRLFGVDTSVFAAIGLVSLLAGCANTPISAIIMSIELFGPQLAPYAAVACIISFLMTGHRSVYPSQILSIRKSASIHVDLGKNIADSIAFAQPRQKSLSSYLIKAVRACGESLRRRKR